VLLMAATTFGYERAFPQTPIGEFEIKTLPASVLLETKNEGRYFDESNGLFYRLFRYISRHDIKMTVPVEAGLETASMKFYVGSRDQEKTLPDEESVKVLRLPLRTVASHGGRGAYRESNLQKAQDDLQIWIEGQPGMRIVGEPYAIFWDGPYKPGFMKRYEIHIPVSIEEE